MQSDIPSSRHALRPLFMAFAATPSYHRPSEIKLPVNLGDNLFSALAVFFGDQNKAPVLGTLIGMGNRFLWFARIHEMDARSR